MNTQTGEMSYGFASNLRDALPNASFIGLTPSLSILRRASRDIRFDERQIDFLARQVELRCRDVEY